MSCGKLNSNFFQLLDTYKKHENDKIDLIEEKKIADEFCSLDDECKIDFIVIILNELSQKREVILTKEQEQELEMHNQKTMIDLKNSVTKAMVYGLLIMICLVYVFPIATDGSLKPLEDFVTGLFSFINNW